jgi:peptide/nickel transport system permease protein
LVIFLGKRLVYMLLTMLAVSILVFLLLEVNGEAVATKVLGPYISEEQRRLWLEANGYLRPWSVRYVEWLGRILSGDFGESIVFKVPVAGLLAQRLANTGVLGAVVLAVMVPLSIALGVLAGMREGSWLDRSISFVSVLTTSIPEFASAVLLTFVFSYWLGWLPGISMMAEGFDPVQLILPAMVLILYGFGYITRMMRASMAEVMQTAYIRAAVLKGIPFRHVVTRHALRNALIAPFTVIILQVNWLLSGVLVVEFAFAYKGFGALLLEGALNQDIYVIEACALVSVFVAVATQTVADIAYTYLNPRIRFT